MPRKVTVTERASHVRFNAMKHGFARRLPIIPAIEDEADWKRHLKGMNETFNPVGYFEELLVRRLATALWEADRLTAYQVAATMSNVSSTLFSAVIQKNYMAKPEEREDLGFYEALERQQGVLLPSRDDLELIMRYGNSLHRQWIQVHNQLLATQARRRGEKAPVAMFDMSAPPPNFGPFRAAPSIPASLLKEVSS